jgi:hypothetical protein
MRQRARRNIDGLARRGCFHRSAIGRSAFRWDRELRPVGPWLYCVRIGTQGVALVVIHKLTMVVVSTAKRLCRLARGCRAAATPGKNSENAVYPERVLERISYQFSFPKELSLWDRLPKKHYGTLSGFARLPVLSPRVAARRGNPGLSCSTALRLGRQNLCITTRASLCDGRQCDQRDERQCNQRDGGPCDRGQSSRWGCASRSILIQRVLAMVSRFRDDAAAKHGLAWATFLPSARVRQECLTYFD